MPNSRRKGANGEREFRDVLRAHGFEAHRDGQQRFGHRDLTHNIPWTHLEVKRRETVAIDSWCRQAEEDAGPDENPVVVWRRSKAPWRAAMPATRFLAIMRELVTLRRRVRELEEEAEAAARTSETGW